MNIREIVCKAVELVPGVLPYLSDKALAIKTIGQYDRQLWSYALALFRGGDSGEFIDKFATAIKVQLTKAFHEGAGDIGVSPDEFTDADKKYLQVLIDSEYDHVLNLASDIEAARDKTEEEFRTSFRSRIDLWINRYTEVVNDARIYFGGKTKLQWNLGETEEHCEQCIKLSGIIAFAYEWEESGIKPQNPPNPVLTCRGWKCDCTLDVTDKRRSPNALKRLMDIAVEANI